MYARICIQPAAGLNLEPHAFAVDAVVIQSFRQTTSQRLSERFNRGRGGPVALGHERAPHCISRTRETASTVKLLRLIAVQFGARCGHRVSDATPNLFPDERVDRVAPTVKMETH
jgi:hypothetical protein